MKFINTDFPYAVWTFTDLLRVTVGVLGGGALFYFCTLLVAGDRTSTLQLATYVGSLLMIVFPLCLVKKKFGLSKEILGLRNGRLGFLSGVLIGTSLALIYSFVVQLTPLRYASLPVDLKPSFSLADIILVPLSVSGFASTVLVPISEEVMIRGFIYGYFRKRTGRVSGLVLQALLFSLLHFSYTDDNAIQLFIHYFAVGLMLGGLYEKTGSLYPSIACHGVINYFAIILVVVK